MTATETTYECSPSTTEVYKWGRILTAPQAPTKQPRRALRRPRLALWDRRHPLTITVKYRGGSEGWYEIRARGQVFRSVGCLALHDVMTSICEGDGRTP